MSSPRPAPAEPARSRELRPGRRRVLACLSALLILLGAGLLFGPWHGPAGSSSSVPSVSSVVPSISVPANPPKYLTKKIRDIQLGDWVLADNPLLTDEERGEFDEIEPAGWRRVALRMEKSDGGTLQIELLRPVVWLDVHGVEPGATIYLDLTEMGAEGEAEVLSVGPCREFAEKPHAGCRVVTGKFAHSSGEVIDVRVEGLDEPIGTTANHLFWSEDRHEFVEAGRLQPGETLRTADGTLTHVAGIMPRTTPQRVYNLEVDVEHVYFVGRNGVLVHNSYVYHHTIPRQIRKPRSGRRGLLPEHLIEDPDIRGCAGNPNRWRIPKDKHDALHPPNGDSNARWIQELKELKRTNPDTKRWTSSDITSTVLGYRRGWNFLRGKRLRV